MVIEERHVIGMEEAASEQLISNRRLLSIIDDWVVVDQYRSLIVPQIQSPIWFRFHWVLTYKVFREYFFDVHFNETVRLWSRCSDSGHHGTFEMIDGNTFKIKVHLLGNSSPWKHEVVFYRSHLSRGTFLGYERGRSLCVLTEIDNYID